MSVKHVGKLGIGIASVLLISRWMSANAMFTASEATIKYGILASQLFAIMGALAFAVFGLIGIRARQQKKDATSILEIFNQKLDMKTRRYLYLLFGIGYGLDFLLLALGASIIFYATVGLHPSIGVLLFIAFGLPLFFFRTYKNYGKYIFYKIGLFQAVIIVIIVYLFLSSNLEEMYFRMRLFHPYLFTIHEEEVLLFTIAVFIIFLGKLVTDFGSWNILFQIKERKIRQSFFLSGLFWGTIPLCFTIIIFPVLYKGGFQSIYTIYYDLLYSFQSDIMLILTASTILMTLVTTYYTRLHEFLRLFENIAFKKRTNLAPFITVLAILFLYGVFYVFQPELLELFFFAGVLNSSLLVPILFSIFTKRHAFDRMLFITISSSLLAGYLAYSFVSVEMSILIPCGLSLIILGASQRFNKKRF
ncbi:hypothetical protein ACFSCX_10470 [Bacillus salitolerans]|uniref:Uncharacterized protein n=1 Tax=Bacillus salitolerans TaxID=1437434 RepID=A0ABW4LPF8_9BACI